MVVSVMAMTPRWISDNFWTKIASVCLAVLVWLYVSGEENMDITHEIPVRIKLPSDAMLVDISQPSIRVTFRGAKSILQKVDFEKIQYFRDLSANLQPGKITFILSENDIQMPKFVSVANIMPQELSLVVDHIAEKEMAVEPALSGTPMEGFKVDGVSVNPSVVKVKGPAGMLKRSGKIGTQEVDLRGRNRSFFQKVGISPLVKGQEMDTLVEVYVRIREEVEEKVFDHHPIKILQSASQSWEVQLDPQEVSVSIGGNKEFLNKLTAGEVTVFLDLAELKPGSYELPLQHKAPKEAMVLKVNPSSVKVKPKEAAAK